MSVYSTVASVLGSPAVQAGLSVAAQVAIARAMRPKTPRLRPTTESRISREGVLAADRERRRRALADGENRTILTGPLGAIESPMVRRTILSGG
jgi:hypothetical protein